MKISGQQTLLFGEANSISLPGDSHASHTALRESERERKMIATSGRKCLEQFGRFNRVTSWAKMFAGSLIGMEDWYSTRCRLTWKLKATKCSRFYFQLQASEPPTDEIGFGLLRTPLVMDTNEKTDLGKIDARRKRLKEKNNGKNGTKYSGNSFGQTLGEMMQRGLLPTPKASDGIMGLPRTSGRPPEKSTHLATRMKYAYNNMLPTPNASDYRSGMINRTGGAHNQSLNDQMALQAGKTSQLNPLFVTEMMGFPVDWLTLPFQDGEGKA